jgi:hypothetical protein
MMVEVEKWLDIAYQAWNSLLDDYERFGSEDGYGHMREEDIRSYLFCKIKDLLQKRKESLLELHADVPLPGNRADIVLGFVEEDTFSVGIEIKRVGQRKPLIADLRKLCVFMKEEKIKYGILAALVKHYDDWETIFEGWELAKRFHLESKEKASNNYWEIRKLKEIKVEGLSIKWDSLFFVLRHL